jgi:hypothetical protein
MSREALDARVYEFNGKDGSQHFIPIANLSDDTIFHAVGRAFYHVLSNEAGAPASTKRKKDGFLADDVANEMTVANRAKLLARILDNTWGAPGTTRAPRGPSGMRLQTIFDQLLEAEVRAKIAQSPNYKPIEGKPDTWMARNRAGNEVEATLESFKASYLAATDGVGDKRRDDLMKIAQDQYDIERRAAEVRKEKKAHLDAAAAETTFDI